MSGNNEEIELLERVLLRLGCADSDEQLQNTVTKFLAPVLLKITSPHENVRLKVMEVLTHINKRLKTRPMIQIPIQPIIAQYQQTESSFAMNFTIIYITMGFPRLPIETQTELAPELLKCLAGKPELHQDKILTLVVPLLGTIKMPDDPMERKKLLGLSEQPTTKNQLLAFIQDVLLLPYGVTQDGEVPAGMSNYSFKRIIVNNWKADELEQYKKGLVRFLCSGVFSDADAVVPLIVASADTRFSVATPAIAELGKICISLDWNDPILSAPLYTLFSGNGSKILEKKSSPCNVRVRQKLLQYLLKCRHKGINTAKGIQVIFEALFGEQTNQKCKVLALQFCENLVKDGPPELINKLSKVILSGITKLIGPNSTESFDVQSAAYCSMSQLATVCPDVVSKDLQIVVSYFNHLTTAPTEIQGPIKEALLAIAPAFNWKSVIINNTLDSNQTLLLALLAEHAESESTVVQSVVIVYLTTCFPEYFVPSRYLLLLIAGAKSSLREMILCHLYGVPKKDHINYSLLWSFDNKHQVEADKKPIILPNFNDMVNYVSDMAIKRAANPNQRNVNVIGKNVLPFTMDTYIEMLDYLRICLWCSAGIKSPPGINKDIENLTIFIKTNYQDSATNGVQKYITLIKSLLMVHRGFSELSCLYDIFNAAPEIVSKQGVDLMQLLSNSLKDVNEDSRTIVAQLYGILLAHNTTDDEFNTEIISLINGSNKSLEFKHGSLIASSYGFSRKISILKNTNLTTFNQLKEWKELKNMVDVLVANLTEQQALLVSAAIRGIAFIGGVTALPLSDYDNSASSSDKNMDDNQMDVDDVDVSIEKSKDFVLRTLLKIITSNSSKQKLREESCHCLARLTFGDGKFFTHSVLKGFIAMNKLTKDPALHIAIGQSIVKIIHGNDKQLDVFDSTEITTNIYFDDEQFEWLLQELINLISQINPNSRQAVAIWLLALVKSCSKRPIIIKKRQLLQFAFTELLSEDNELVQDVASRGLGEIFSLSDENSQSELANSLLDQLTGGRQQVMQVTADTKIFEEGTLGKTPTGENITTYKELCNLASDLNQPDLIYQFMQLANHNATWNSKLGAAFGLKSISKMAKVKMQPHLVKIIPRLFRYKYDPTPKIQNSMISIWDSLVTNSKETIDMYYWEILNEINANLTSPEWRTRISCCLAMRDLIKGPGGLKLKTNGTTNDNDTTVETELIELWSQLFRVMDDIHEGTRLAAEGSANILSKACIVASSSDHGKSGMLVAKSILPLLLEKGITNVVPEIRKLSIRTVSEMIDTAGPFIRSHLSQLIPCLLQATGELEVTKLSYLSTRFGGQSEVQEAVDSMRAEAAKQHHTMQTLNKCIRYIDYPTLENITPAVLDLMKTSVNLGTKVACAHFMCLISIRLGKEMTPLTGKYLNVCYHGLSDRNVTVRKYYASAIGHLIGIAKEQSVLKLFTKLNEFYNDRQSVKSQSVPIVLQSINKRYQEVLKDHLSLALPLIFFAMHEEVNDDNKAAIEVWKDLWNEISPGDSGIRLHLDSILPNLLLFLNDSSWSLKVQSANAIKALATKLGTNLDDKDRESLLKGLLASLSGRTFQGKERLLQALASLCKNYKKSDNGLHVVIIDAVMKECRKEEPVYRTHCLKALGDILDAMEEDRFEEVYNMVWYLLDNSSSSSSTSSTSSSLSSSSSSSVSQSTAMDDDDLTGLSAEERNKKILININLKETVCETLGKAWPINSVETQKKYQILFVQKCVECLNNNTRPVQLSLLGALGRFLERLKILESVEQIDPDVEMEEENRGKKVKVDLDNGGVVDVICKTVFKCVVLISNIPHTGLKKEVLSILLTLIKKLKEKQMTTQLTETKETFQNVLEAFRKDGAPEIKCRLNDIEEKLKNV